MKATLNKQPIAVITGASSGLGEAFVYALANEGYRLILLARRKERLKEIQSKVLTDCQIHQVDLSNINAVNDILKILPSHIDLLICNSGYRISAEFEDADPTVITQQISCMIDAHNRLMQHYLKTFKENKNGQIIVVSSIAGLLPSPGPLYGPIKAYQHHQAINLHAHYKHHGIHCMSLCPGLIRTEFHTVNGLTDWSNISSCWWMTADQVAKKSLKKLQKKKTFYIPGWYNQLLYMAIRHLPITIQQWWVQRFFEKSKI